jgi:type IV fimbrial biogenesis protein FimT
MLATLSPCPRRRPERGFHSRGIVGFTLIELMVTISLAAILAVIAVPSFQQFTLNQRLKNAAYDVVSALTLARSEAITRNAVVSVVASGGVWANGWCVTTTDCTAAIVRRDALNSGITVTAGTTTVTFGNAGRLSSGSNAVVFAINPASVVSGVSTRCVTLSLSGVSRISTTTTGSCS